MERGFGGCPHTRESEAIGSDDVLSGDSVRAAGGQDEKNRCRRPRGASFLLIYLLP